ncbi:hypothetical protein ABZ914_19880 [Spirillospora sp. NPDC046719]
MVSVDSFTVTLVERDRAMIPSASATRAASMRRVSGCLASRRNDAAVECLVFPKTHTLHGQTLAEDRVISVRGRTHVRDETLSVYGEDITTLDLSQAATEPPVVIHLHEDRLNLQLVQELKQTLATHPGRTPVHLLLHRHGPKSVLFDLRPFQVTPGPAFFGEIKALLGPASHS